MRYKIYGLAIALIIAIVTIAGCGGKQMEPAIPAQETPVDDDTWILLIGEQGNYFHKAREDFLAKDMYAAAMNIRKGTSILRMELSRAKGEGKAALKESVDELNKLANDVEMGKVKSAKKLNDTFARANHALAVHHHQKASEYWAKGDAERAGHALRGAASGVERAASWSGTTLEAGTIATINGTRFLAGSLIQATGWTIGTGGKVVSGTGTITGKGVGAVGKGVAAVGKGAGRVFRGAGKGTSTVVKGVATGTGKAVGGVAGGAGEAVSAVGGATGDVVGGVTGGAGKAIGAVGAGVAWVPNEVGQSIGDLGDEIEKLGKAVEPPKKK